MMDIDSNCRCIPQNCDCIISIDVAVMVDICGFLLLRIHPCTLTGTYSCCCNQ